MKIGILISGRGSNMAAIVDALQRGDIPGAEAVVVISDKPSAEGLKKAADRGVETLAVPRAGRPREDHDREIVGHLKDRGVELVCLAGYMRLLSKEFVNEFPNRIINIHPSLLPSFKGLDAQRQAFDYGVKVTGCTVHFVDAELDHGAIIMQNAISVEDGDSADTLSARILKLEHALYIESLRRIVSGGYRIEGRRVVFSRSDKKMCLNRFLPTSGSLNRS
jgi:phosphoribosylglycinamide formyltransferase-1